MPLAGGHDARRHDDVMHNVGHSDGADDEPIVRGNGARPGLRDARLHGRHGGQNALERACDRR